MVGGVVLCCLPSSINTTMAAPADTVMFTMGPHTHDISTALHRENRARLIARMADVPRVW
jgi:hypothetical protein